MLQKTSSSRGRFATGVDKMPRRIVDDYGGSGIGAINIVSAAAIRRLGL
jgi:hypothetical protein